MPVFKALRMDARQTDPLVSPHLRWARQQDKKKAGAQWLSIQCPFLSQGEILRAKLLVYIN